MPGARLVTGVSGSPAAALVTGASGFIGRRLCQRLQGTGVEVRAIMRTPATGPWHAARCMDLAGALPPAEVLDGVDTVFHLAGRAHAMGDPRGQDALYQSANVDATGHVAEAAAQAGARMVFVSSVKAMGEGGAEPQDANGPCHPESAYGRSKLAAEALVLERVHARGLDARILRPCLVHGPAQPGNLERMFRAVARRWFPPLRVTHNRRSLVHVDDVVDALLALATTPGLAGRCYVVSGPRPWSTLELHGAMARALGRAPPGWTLPVGAIAPLARLGDWLGTALGRRLPLDSAALARLTESACYSEALLTRDTGFRSSRGLEETLAALANDFQHGGRR